MTFDVLVEVKLRPGISDPAGQTVEKSLPTLGFTDVSRRAHRQGDPPARSKRPTRPPPHARVEDLCTRFLTNPVIEDSVVTINARVPA